ncbi:hypothetical protein COLO4_18749 [Corchorus olitorius]|uniref:Uncharacterized protein n=1 Tax=Corchorus olitorius TaxID=93759 RepID=A0A1R3J832_9ROSI|nr:hypothetical protein COLO4_18749 [Corchorus olitorius]
MASQKLTEYERKRLENIKRNEEMMAALKVQSKAASLAAISKRQSVKSYQESSVKKPKTETPIVIRRSLRTRGMPPDSKGLDDEFRENSVKIPNFEKQSPRPLGPLSMNDAFCGDNMESNKLLIGTILSVAKKNQVGVSVKGEFNDGEDVKEENLSYKKGKLGSFESEVLECPLKVEKFDENLSGESGFVTCGLVKGVVQDENLHGLVEIEMSDSLLESMDLKPENVARVFPGRAMLVKFFPCSNMRMIAAGNKSGNIAFWNVDWEDEMEMGFICIAPMKLLYLVY